MVINSLKINFKRTIKILIPFLITLLIISNIVMNSAFIFTQAHHECSRKQCDDNKCTVCIQINEAIAYLSSSGSCTNMVNNNPLLVVMLILFIFIYKNKYVRTRSLVSLKVRLDI